MAPRMPPLPRASASHCSAPLALPTPCPLQPRASPSTRCSQRRWPASSRLCWRCLTSATPPPPPGWHPCMPPGARATTPRRVAGVGASSRVEHWSLAGSLHSALPPLTPPLLTRPPPFPCPHRLQVWHVPRSSRASWMSSLRTIVDINTNLSSKFWVGEGRETRWGRDPATRPRQWLRPSAMPPLFKLHVPDPPASHCLPLPPAAGQPERLLGPVTL